MRTSLSNDIALDLPSSLNPEATRPGPLVLSPRLHNKDLAPTKVEGRRWGRYSIFALWTNDVHNIANYSFAIGLYALGLGGWQILLSLGIGAALVYFFMNLSGYMGQKTGVPFPVISRISFGIHGAQIPALIRAVIAIAWFGIQTYLASVVFRVLLTAIHPAFADYSRGVNLRAVAAFFPAAVIAILLALLPGFASVSPFSWMFGSGIAALLYGLIAKRQPFYADVSGESIAVDNVSH